MAKKLNSETNVVPDKSFFPYDKGLDGKNKKPLLERLGFIEPIVKIDKKEDFDMLDDDAAITSEVRLVSENNDSAEMQERAEKASVEKLPIKTIFEKFGLETKETSTVYLIENFMKALPNNLPADIKRQSIINLISASQLDITSLLKDGSRRLDVLNNYINDFSNNVAETILSNEKQIRKLNERIAYHNRIIEDKQNMRDAQKSEVAFEIQKIANIIDFIENKSE
jgi:predicted phage tail protein